MTNGQGILQKHYRYMCRAATYYHGPFLTVNQSMFTENDVANQWHSWAHNNLCPTLHKRICAFCLWSSLWAVDPGMNRKR